MVDGDAEAPSATEPDAGWVRALDAVRRVIERISGLGGAIAAYLVVAIFVIGILNVVLRYYGRAQGTTLVSNLWVDAQWQLFGLLFLVGVGYGVREGVNPRVDFWYSNFSERRRALIDLIGHTVLLVPFCWMAVRLMWPFGMAALGRRTTADGTSWETWRVWEIWEESNNPNGLPLGPIKFMMVIGFALFGLQIVAEIIKRIFVLTGRSELAGLSTTSGIQRIE
ncbi:MAG: TRAP transporter small permease subunit [Actinomycetota bacterium]|nr:TRAP transporter small permease subunit [Actinomycetota bacterium]